MDRQSTDALSRPMRRRTLLRMTALSGASMLGAQALAACGGGSDAGGGASSSATLRMMNYPGWMGENEVAEFRATHPGFKLKQITGGANSTAEIVSLIAQNTEAYDFGLMDLPAGGQLKAGGFIEALDESQVPNLAQVDPRFRDAFTEIGMPQDYGIVGIAWRRDLVKQPITSWEDLWKLAPSYRGRIVVVDYDDLVLGTALKYLGRSFNSDSEADLAAAADALKELKPSIQAFKEVDTSRPLIGDNPSAAISIDFNFSVAQVQRRDPRIEYVVPAEGAPGYLEGWGIVRGTQHRDLIHEFMNFHLEPRNYATFLEATGNLSIMRSAVPLVDPSLRNAQAFNPSSADLDRVEFSRYVSPERLALMSRHFEEVKGS